ncbi:adenylate/guanylate cyclase domain-containing protein [Rheinheimera riviphila]|uniref:Adenylate/guanylate cyclase domain-containing protein n=1 Tax=Rheinheimera riviphila TaxID=1834037 RepID=A0A437R087_9GAMM|nr:adenylate/guanylate cyclase domain-containing protein [Rheinheimera riviphila]RVU40150.1 adenylate/guanylate cyclase domain-containing protein [Rheinheimera riviphila]
MTRSRLRKWLARQSMPLLLLALVLTLQWLPPPGLERSLLRLEGLLYDAKVQYLPPWPRSVSNIQIVDIDEASLHEIGRMPWDRSQFERLTTRLAEAGAVLVVYDVLFSEPQANVALTALHSWPQQATLSDGQRQSLLTYAAGLDPDLQFAATMQSVEVVLANVLHRHGRLRTGQIGHISDTGQTVQQSVQQQRPAGTTPFEPFSGFAAPISSLANAASGQGFINAEADADGFIRRVALLHELDKQLYPSLALEAFRVYSLVEQLQPAWLQQAGHAYLQGVQIGNSLIRTDQQGRILIPFRGGARHYPYSSAADVLRDRIDDQRFDQAVVFVGTSATGLADLQATPTSLTFPGVEIHATVFDGLMAPDSLPYRPDWWAGAMLLQLLMLGMFCLWLFPRLGPLSSVAAALLLMLLAVGVNLWLWRVQVLDLPLLNLLLLLVLLSVYYISYGFVRETRRRKQINAVFDQYLPPAHIQRLLDDPGSVSLAGEKKQLSVLFCDIRSFTAISEQMSAQELKLWLNQYFSVMTQAIQAHDGTIDKYVGDMVMAFWGAPLAEPAHASKSILAAFAMLHALELLNQQYQAAGKPVARIGIGIHTGEMNVGDMGSDFRRSYTVIGDAVNLGSRLEGLTKFYGVPLLVSEDTKAEASELAYLLVDKVRVKGKQIPIRIYLPLDSDIKEPLLSHCQTFEQALAAYFQQQFIQAREQLLELQQALQVDAKLPEQPNLSGLITLYLQRIDAFLQQGPGADWDGSYSHASK